MNISMECTLYTSTGICSSTNSRDKAVHQTVNLFFISAVDMYVGKHAYVHVLLYETRITYQLLVLMYSEYTTALITNFRHTNPSSITLCLIGRNS